MRRMATLALARMTWSDCVRQPLAYLMTTVSVALIALSAVFGMFNFVLQDRMRMLATAGVAEAVINGLFLAVVMASVAIHDELASRTALTLFAKPVSRSKFIFGKALGIFLVVAASTMVVIAAHAGALWLGASTGFEMTADPHRHDHLEALGDEPWVPWGRLAAAHALGLSHSAVLTSIATVLALRLPLIANVIACFAVFVLGHLLTGAHTLGALVVPALPLFNIDDAVQFPTQACSGVYFAFSVLYAVLYCTGILAVGLAVFSRQDIP
jgi:hypothetical protein